MNCRQAKREIALCVGEDLTDADRRAELRGHLTGCPDCREHLKRLKGMFQVFERAEGQQTYDCADSIWPGLSGRLGQPRPRLPGPRFNGWVPFSVMAAACVLLMIVMEMQPSSGTPVSGSLMRGIAGPLLGDHSDATARSMTVPNRQETPPNSAFISGPSQESLVPPAEDPVDHRSAPDSTF